MSAIETEYISTGGETAPATFLSAMKRGLASDGGLFLPDRWPDLSEDIWKRIGGGSMPEIGGALARAFIPEISPGTLKILVDDALTFDAPLLHLHDRIFILELFHGPTLAFKDFGARFMARMMEYEGAPKDQKRVILVATSGDTGSAVGRAFEGVGGTEVCLLYPGGKVSRLQEKQLTTIGGNVTALEIEGTFDDCQKLVKRAFSDEVVRDRISLSSANSINIARLLPQMFYYGRALAQLDSPVPAHFCVPSGNFGNLTAGMMAEKTGMPARQFIAATNINDTVPRFLEEGKLTLQSSRKTLSSAMDVGNPSNLERIRSIHPRLGDLKKHLWAASFTDEQTKSAIAKVFGKYGRILDPHTAVGYLAAGKYMAGRDIDAPVILLATAHPAKFSGIVEPLIGEKITLPAVLKSSLERDKKSIEMPSAYGPFRRFLIDNYAA